MPGAEQFRPFADVAVLDGSGARDGTHYVDRFYLAAEVLSDGDTDKDIPAKSREYVRHPQLLYFLILEQKQVRVEVRARASEWEPAILEGLSAVLELPEWAAATALPGREASGYPWLTLHRYLDTARAVVYLEPQLLALGTQKC